MIVPNREELAWAAGFWDGEGCTYTGFSDDGRPYITLTIGQVFRPNLERFQAAVGGLGKISKPFTKLRKDSYNRQPISQWRTSKFEQAQAVMAMLWQFLSQEKKDQYRRVLDITKSDSRFYVPISELRAKGARAMWARLKAKGA